MKKKGGSSGARTAAIYARFSSHNQREESIEQQVAECRAFAEREGATKQFHTNHLAEVLGLLVR